MIKYISVQIELCAKFAISFQENAYLTAIAGLQTLEKNNFWAVMSNAEYCEALTISERTLQNMSKELEKKGLLIRGIGTQKRASSSFCEALVILKTEGAEFALRGAEFAPIGVQNLRGVGAEFAPNNKKINKGINKDKDIEHERENSENAFENAVSKNRKAATELPNVQAPFESDKNKALWSDWQEHLRQKGKAPSRVTLEAHAKELRYHDEATANAMIVQAIAKGWLSIYPLDKKQEAKQPAPPQPKTNSLPPGAFTIT